MRYQSQRMNLKNFLLFAFAFLALAASAQNKVFAFSEIQSRDNVQKWGSLKCVAPQLVRFTPEKIDLKIDEKYHLTILSKTELPDRGTIYLCNDEQLNSVTVMLIDNSKMFLYFKNKRFQINFDTVETPEFVARNY